VPTAHELIQSGLIGEALEQGPALVFVADDRMKYIAVNDLAARTLGYDRSEILSLHVTDVVRDPAAAEHYGEMIRAGRRTGETKLTTRDGRELDFEYRATKTRIAGLEFFISVGFVDAVS
jgi:PAS domain S-box-containing protein